MKNISEITLQDKINILVEDTRKSLEYKEEDFYCKFMLIVRNKLKRQNISQKQLAKKINMKESLLSRILAREANPTIKTMVKILDAVEYEIMFEPKRSFSCFNASMDENSYYKGENNEAIGFAA